MKNIISVIVSILLFSSYSFEKEELFVGGLEDRAPSFLTEGVHEVEIDGVKLWYLVKGEGPILIVYPPSAGWGGDCSILVEHMKPLEKYRKVVYLEPRGVGRSGRLESMHEYCMDKYVQELDHFRRELDIQAFDLMGFCYSGFIAMKYALKHQQYLNHLILISTLPKFGYPGYQDWVINRSGYANMVKKNEEINNGILEGEERLKEEKKNWFSLTFYEYEKHKANFERVMDNTIFSELPLQQFNTVDSRSYNVLDSIHLIHTKTLILYGKDDFPPVVYGSKDINSRIEGSKIVELEKSAHWPFIEQPELFFAETISFLEK